VEVAIEAEGVGGVEVETKGAEVPVMVAAISYRRFLLALAAARESQQRLIGVQSLGPPAELPPAPLDPILYQNEDKKHETAYFPDSRWLGQDSVSASRKQ
jgi:hypothetical protein